MIAKIKEYLGMIYAGLLLIVGFLFYRAKVGRDTAEDQIDVLKKEIEVNKVMQEHQHAKKQANDLDRDYTEFRDKNKLGG